MIIQTCSHVMHGLECMACKVSNQTSKEEHERHEQVLSLVCLFIYFNHNALLCMHASLPPMKPSPSQKAYVFPHVSF